MSVEHREKVERVIAIGKHLRQLRVDRGFSADDFAKSIGVSVSSMRSWENGYSIPTWDKLVKLADILDTTIDHILGREYKRQNPLDSPDCFWAGVGGQIATEENGAVTLSVKFPIGVSVNGNTVVLDGGKTVRFENADAFKMFHREVVNKMKTFCITEVMVHHDD